MYMMGTPNLLKARLLRYGVCARAPGSWVPSMLQQVRVCVRGPVGGVGVHVGALLVIGVRAH